ncbi:MAG TPA: hypothetical protein VK638_58235 [Edaphobacter sp.]|nr:hypothetical protein [Edaphobacter sp.]
MKKILIVMLLTIPITAQQYIDKTVSDKFGSYRVYGDLDQHGCFSMTQKYERGYCVMSIDLISPNGEIMNCSEGTHGKAGSLHMVCSFIPKKKDRLAPNGIRQVR